MPGWTCWSVPTQTEGTQIEQGGTRRPISVCLMPARGWFATDCANHCPPRAVAMPLTLSSAAIHCNKEHCYSITSSATASRACGTARPSILAVLRLMTRSNLVGCSTGRRPASFLAESYQRVRPRDDTGRRSSGHKTSGLRPRQNLDDRATSAVVRRAPR
jgi:hypothetical protein